MRNTFNIEYVTKDEVVCTVECIDCHRVHQLVLPLENFVKWQHGELIQNAFPELSAEKRELLISGICPECWDKMFGDEEE